MTILSQGRIPESLREDSEMEIGRVPLVMTITNEVHCDQVVVSFAAEWENRRVELGWTVSKDLDPDEGIVGVLDCKMGKLECNPHGVFYYRVHVDG